MTQDRLLVTLPYWTSLSSIDRDHLRFTWEAENRRGAYRTPRILIRAGNQKPDPEALLPSRRSANADHLVFEFACS